MDSTYIIDVMKARQLYAEADDISWSEGREKLELLKQADKACKAALKKSPDALDALMLSARIFVQMAEWQVDHPQASKRYFKRALDRFREAAEAHPDEEQPYRGWAKALHSGRSYIDVSPAHLRGLLIDCAKWCERRVAQGHRSEHVKLLWQAAGELLERVFPDEPELAPRLYKETIYVRRRLLETFDDDVDLLCYEALGMVRVAGWLIDSAPEDGREVYEYLLTLPERIEEIDPDQAHLARVLEVEALRSMAFRQGAEGDEVTELWARAEQAFCAAREALADERDNEGRAGDREALLFKDFTSESFQLAIEPAYEGHSEAERMVERTLELLRETPEVLSSEESDRHLLRIVRDLPEVATAFRDFSIETARHICEQALSLLGLVDEQAIPEAGRLRLRAEVFDHLRLIFVSIDGETALRYAREAADHYAASDEVSRIEVPDVLSKWSRAAAHASQQTEEPGESWGENQYSRAVAKALARLDEWDDLNPVDLYLWAMTHAMTVLPDTTTKGTAANEDDMRFGIDLACRALRQAEKGEWMPPLVVVGMTLASKLCREDEADALMEIAAAVESNVQVVDSPKYIEALFAARLGEIDRAIDAFEEALEAGEIEYADIASIDFGKGLTENETWKDFLASHAPNADDEAAEEQVSPETLTLPLNFGEAGLSAVE